MHFLPATALLLARRLETARCEPDFPRKHQGLQPGGVCRGGSWGTTSFNPVIVPFCLVPPQHLLLHGQEAEKSADSPFVSWVRPRDTYPGAHLMQLAGDVEAWGPLTKITSLLVRLLGSCLATGCPAFPEPLLWKSCSLATTDVTAANHMLLPNMTDEPYREHTSLDGWPWQSPACRVILPPVPTPEAPGACYRCPTLGDMVWALRCYVGGRAQVAMEHGLCSGCLSPIATFIGDLCSCSFLNVLT